MSIRMGFFVQTQVAENSLDEIHLIVSNSTFSIVLDKNKKLPLQYIMGVFITIKS
jgi:hypothetical protein